MKEFLKTLQWEGNFTLGRADGPPSDLYVMDIAAHQLAEGLLKEEAVSLEKEERRDFAPHPFTGKTLRYRGKVDVLLPGWRESSSVVWRRERLHAAIKEFPNFKYFYRPEDIDELITRIEEVLL